MRHDLTERVWAEVDSLITSILPLLACAQLSPGLVRQAAASAIPVVLEDLQALAAKDSAARDGLDYVWSSYLSFHALLAYRVAHAILHLELPTREEPRANIDIACAARRIAEEAKARTGVEIHPAASIGRRMVIDHGWGTVIGRDSSKS